MKKLFPILLLGLIVPQVALAAWWNPLSWKIFKKSPVSSVESLSVPTRMTKEEYIEKFGEDPFTKEKVSTSTPSSSAKNQSGRPLLSQKETVSSPKISQPGVSAGISRSAQEWVSIIDVYLKDFNGAVTLMEKRINDVKNHKDKHLRNVTETDESAGALFLATNLKFMINTQQMVDALKPRVIELQRIRADLLATNTVNQSTWNESKNKEMNEFSNNTGQAYISAVEEWRTNSTEILEFFKLVSPQSNRPSVGVSSQLDSKVTAQLDYLNKLKDMRSVIKAEIESNGGYASASQVEYLAVQRLKEAGIVMPSVVPSGRYYNESSGYTSVKCNSLGSGYDCYGSDGTRIQSHQIPGSSSFQINSW